MKTKPVLAITPGDPDGIGPEVVWKALRKSHGKSTALLLCIGARKPFERLKAPIAEAQFTAQGKLMAPQAPNRKGGPFVWLLPAPETAPSGKLLPGFQSGWSIERATEL